MDEFNNGVNKEPEKLPDNKENKEKRIINYNTNYNTNYDNNRGKKSKGCLFAFIIALVVVIGFIVVGLAAVGTVAAVLMPGTQEAEETASGPYIGLIDISGTIQEESSGYMSSSSYDHSWTLSCIENFKNDSDNKGIIVYINSPGGGVYESDELYNTLLDYKNETGRPVFAYMAQEAASGGLFAAMAADEITANRMTLTGSIGVIMSSTDLTGLYDKLGIKTNEIVSGKNKDMFSNMNDEQRAILQSIVDEYYEYFVDAVADGRGLDRDYVKQIGDGRVYTAKQAKEIGLIDNVGTYDDMINDILSRNEFQNCEIYSYTQYKNTIIDYVLQQLGFSAKARNGVLSEAYDAIDGGKNRLEVSFK